ASGAEEDGKHRLAHEAEDAAHEHGRAHHPRAPRELRAPARLDGHRRHALLRSHRAPGLDTRRPVRPQAYPDACTRRVPAAAIGSVTRKVLPAPGALSTSIRPP